MGDSVYPIGSSRTPGKLASRRNYAASMVYRSIRRKARTATKLSRGATSAPGNQARRIRRKPHSPEWVIVRNLYGDYSAAHGS